MQPTPALAAVAAVAGAAAGTAPTGLPAWDGLLAGGVAGVPVYLMGQSFGLPAAVATAVAGQVLLRLPAFGPAGASAVVAALALFAAVTASLRRRPELRRPVVLGLAAAAALASAASAVGGIVGWRASSHLVAGLEAAQDGLRLERAGEHGLGLRRLEQAARELGAADRQLSSAWARPALLVPVVAQHVRAGATAARHGARITRSASALVSAADPRRLRPVDGRIDPAVLRRIQPFTADGLRRLQDGLIALDQVASPWLVPPIRARLAEARGQLLPATRQAADLAAVMDAAPALLGADGPRRWLLALPTPAEDRATVGIIGNYAELAVADGRIEIGRLGRSSDFRDGGETRLLLAPPEFRRRYGRFAPQWVIENVTMSPHFPDVADVLAATHAQLGRPEVDGVLLLDPTALAALVRLSGPVLVPGLDEPLTADNAEDVLLIRQYELFYKPGEPVAAGRGRPEADRARRLEFLAAAAAAVLDGLRSSDLPDVTAIGRILGPAVRGRHLMLWSDRPAEQQLFARLGVDGAMAPVRGDALALVTQNSSGNKIDVYLERSLDYRLALDPRRGRATATATIELRNDAPASGLVDYVIAGYGSAPTRPGENLQIVSLYSPLDALGARLDGEVVELQSDTEQGRMVHSTSVLIPPGATRTLVVELAGELPAGRSYVLDVQRQATVRPDRFSLAVDLPPDFVRPAPVRSAALEEDLHVRLRWREVR